VCVETSRLGFVCVCVCMCVCVCVCVETSRLGFALSNGFDYLSSATVYRNRHLRVAFVTWRTHVI
jgi:hypothetical protein